MQKIAVVLTVILLTVFLILGVNISITDDNPQAKNNASMDFNEKLFELSLPTGWMLLHKKSGVDSYVGKFIKTKNNNIESLSVNVNKFTKKQLSNFNSYLKSRTESRNILLKSKDTLKLKRLGLVNKLKYKTNNKKGGEVLGTYVEYLFFVENFGVEINYFYSDNHKIAPLTDEQILNKFEWRINK